MGTGATWVLVVGEVPNTNDCIGIKFRINTGDVWSMEGDARYKYMHAVAAPFPAGVHKPECLDYKVTGTFRNGLGKCAWFCMFIPSNFSWQTRCVVNLL